MEFIEGKWANDDFFCRFHLSDFQGPVLTVCNAVQYRSTPAIWIGILFTMAACTADSPPQRRHQPVAISQLLVASGQYQSPAASTSRQRPAARRAVNAGPLCEIFLTGNSNQAPIYYCSQLLHRYCQ